MGVVSPFGIRNIQILSYVQNLLIYEFLLEFNATAQKNRVIKIALCELVLKIIKVDREYQLLRVKIAPTFTGGSFNYPGDFRSWESPKSL